jgi:hypothetical protein
MVTLQRYFDILYMYVSINHLGSVMCERMSSGNNPPVLCVSCHVFSSTPTHWTADWILTGMQVVPVMSIGCWEECHSRYQHFSSSVYWFIVHILPGYVSAFR